MNKEDITELTEVVLIALVCPLLLPIVLEDIDTSVFSELKGENNAE